MQILFSKIWCSHSGADENLSLLHWHCLVVPTILKDQITFIFQGSVLWHVMNHFNSDTANIPDNSEPQILFCFKTNKYKILYTVPNIKQNSKHPMRQKHSQNINNLLAGTSFIKKCQKSFHKYM